MLGNAGIAGLQRTTERLSSQIRIYCDNDERFFSNPAGLLPSQVGPRYVFHDKTDWILADTLISTTPSCRNPSQYFAAVTYTGVTEPLDGTIQPPDRSSITLCPSLYENGVTGVGSENSARAMVRAGAVDLLAAVSSVVVVHELAHAVARVDDITYFYDDMIQLSRDDALNNAQSYAYYAALLTLPP